MSVEFPPLELARYVNYRLPGIYARFLIPIIEAPFPGDTVVTSWYRDFVHNREVGGAPQSQHLLGLALDLTSRRPEEILGALRPTGLTVIGESTHVHVQALPAGQPALLGLFV